MKRKRWPRRRLLLIVGASLVLLSVVPMAPLIWDASHNFTPLYVPVTLARGQYESPWFTPDVKDQWQVDLEWSHNVPPLVDSDDSRGETATSHSVNLSAGWKVVDDKSSLIAQGTFAGRLDGANGIRLGSYQNRRGVRQRLLLDVKNDVQGEDAAHPTLKIEDPEPSLDDSYAAPLFMRWAALLAGCGLIALFVAALMRGNPPESSTPQ